MMSEEHWKTVPSMPGWEASSLGRVRGFIFSDRRNRLYGGQPLTGQVPGRGKLQIVFRRKHYAVHRMVCEAFHGTAPPDKPLCMHLDEDFRNNRPENLAWGTQAENMRAPKLRASFSGEKQSAARRKAWVTRRAKAPHSLEIAP